VQIITAILTGSKTLQRKEIKKNDKPGTLDPGFF
jgi:hypothetical protein